MPRINTGSDLVEVEFTPQELNLAQQFMNKDLTLMLLQNTRVEMIRELATFEFRGTTEQPDMQNIRAYAHLQGKAEMLSDLIAQALHPTPIPVELPQEPQQL